MILQEVVRRPLSLHIFGRSGLTCWGRIVSKTEWSGVTVEVTGKDNTVGSVRRYSLGDDDKGKPLILAEEVGFNFFFFFQWRLR